MVVITLLLRNGCSDGLPSVVGEDQAPALMSDPILPLIKEEATARWSSSNPS